MGAYTRRERGRKSLPEVPPKSTTGKMLNYPQNTWSMLVRYLGDGRLAIDNKRIENAIRPFMIGRSYAKSAVMRSPAGR